ncbi:YbaY family lipoprotein [Sphingopyxis alaskensis]|jgi:putative lipoprotein|uniref:Lipoprotein-related protein n=1 Tax=Sphingopyxis alaskensis (strain DSM 13593 / LMG 18877 / RB2256) TaxID=317655 RepID=Q1GNI6_SPHAL|nr:YbaY family lipoprotein [Sphingopyxis alaskensis]ABF54786.1 lipoprotein-related protein [Sphingopyxis alaskensis RB2256]MCM3418374.1 YbaY family lipoprotein [Sphingopyxis alaskensis]
MVRVTRMLAVGMVAAPLLAACATIPPAEQPVTVTGSITYRERIALPPTARVEIALADVSLADAPSTTVARQSFTADGRQVPFAFSLTVDQRQLDPRHSYAVSARISDASGRLMFITDTRNNVPFDGRRVIDMGMLMLVKTH